MAKEKELTPEEVIQLQDENKKSAEELTALKATNEKLTAESAAKDELIKELNEQLNQQEKATEKLGKYPVFAHKGKKYELVDAKSSARFEGKNVVITKETLGEDPKLLEFCIEKGFSCLKEKGGK